MNKSPFINTRKCRTCGKCCKSFSIVYPKADEEEVPIMFSEVKRFQMLNTKLIEVIEKDDRFIVKFNFRCEHLKFKNGIYTCNIYTKDRPELCKQYPYDDTTDCPFMERK